MIKKNKWSLDFPDVLTWMALHLTNHTISKGHSSNFLRAFDEEYESEDGVKGGELKMGFLLSRKIPHPHQENMGNSYQA
jgi:hypothetical protein